MNASVRYAVSEVAKNRAATTTLAMPRVRFQDRDRRPIGFGASALPSSACTCNGRVLLGSPSPLRPGGATPGAPREDERVRIGGATTTKRNGYITLSTAFDCKTSSPITVPPGTS